MHDVFISYSTRDRAVADAILECLEGAGIRCWIAPRDIQPGADWSAAIPPAIDASRAFVLVFSSHANASKQVTREVHVAQAGRGKTLVPFLIEPVEPVGALRYLLSGVQWLDATQEPERHIGRLVERLRILFSEPETRRADRPARDLVPNNLPPTHVDLVGRNRELAEIAEAVREARVVSLTGTGGVGKTRTAVEVGARMLREFPDGAWFVDLAPISDGALIPAAIAEALSIDETPGTAVIDRLVAGLSTKRALIILDNCEHLVEACAGIAAAIVAQTADVRMLCTTRQPLRLPREAAYQLGPLAAPVPRGRAPSVDELNVSPAARLFLERAAAMRPVELNTDGARAAIASICTQLDGIPLALELAAARTKSLSFEQVSAALDRRFKLLTSGARDAAPRQQTLQALIDWSYGLLAEREQRVLRRAGAFAGSFDLDAVAAVSAFDRTIDTLEVLDSVEALLERSLVTATAVVEGKQRYRLLESVRAYAREALASAGELAEVERILLSFVRETVRNATGKGDAHRTLDAEIDNIRTALNIAVTQRRDVALGGELLVELSDYWQASGKWAEGHARYAEALAAGDAIRGDVRTSLLLAAAAVAFYREDYDCVVHHVTEALQGLDPDSDRVGHARALNTLAAAKFALGEDDPAADLWRQSLEILRAVGHEAGTAHVMSNLAQVAWQSRADYIEAAALYEDAVAILRKTGSETTVALCLGNLAEICYARADYLQSIALAEESIAIFRRLGNRSYVADRTLLLAKYAFCLGRRDVAIARAGEALAEFVSLAQPVETADALVLTGQLAEQEGLAEDACRLAGFGMRARAATQRRIPRADRERVDAFRVALSARLGAERAAALFRNGELLSPDAAVSLASNLLSELAVRSRGV